MLKGIMPIVFVPFDDDGAIDEDGLKNIVRFELDGGIDGLGINGFASEAYKLSDDERRRTVEIVATEVAGAVPLIIGIAPGSTAVAIQQAKEYAAYNPAALMVLPPATMDNGEQALIDHYVTLAQASDAPIMVQQSPHIPAYHHCEVSAQGLAQMADRAESLRYFKIEGGGSAAKIAQLKPLLPDDVVMFGGGGGITLLDELRAGAAGLIPGVGFNDYFVRAWQAWQMGDIATAEALINTIAPLVTMVSGKGHEYSLHMRKHMMLRYRAIQHATVRQPTVPFDAADMDAIFAKVDTLALRIAQQG